MTKQVAKSLIFTKEKLTEIQDKMRDYCIKSFNKIYSIDYQLKTKEKGRNKDISVSKMENYRELKKEEENNKKRLQQANDKTDKLNNKTQSVEEIISTLKPTVINKNNYVISNTDIASVKAYIEDVKATTNSVKGVNDLDVIMKEYGKDLEEHDNKIWTLNRKIQQKDTKIMELSEDLNIAKDIISKQNTKISFLQEQLSFFKDVWHRLKKLFEIRIRGDNDKNFIAVTDELYDKGIFDKDDVDRIKTGTVKNINKEKDWKIRKEVL